MADVSVLVVSHQAFLRKALQSQLSKCGYIRVLEAHSPEEALRVAARVDNQFDLILLDHRKSGLDGYALTKRLKESGCSNQIPVILLSSQARWFGSVKPDPLWGPDVILRRPFSRVTLAKAISRAIHKRAASRNGILILADAAKVAEVQEKLSKLRNRFWKRVHTAQVLSPATETLNSMLSETGLLILDDSYARKLSRKELSKLRRFVRRSKLVTLQISEDFKKPFSFPSQLVLKSSDGEAAWRNALASAAQRRQWSWKMAQIVRRAKAFQSQQLFVEALGLVKLALKLDPSNAEYYVRLGDLYRFLRHKRRALKAYRTASKLDPQRPFLEQKVAALDVLQRGARAQ